MAPTFPDARGRSAPWNAGALLLLWIGGCGETKLPAEAVSKEASQPPVSGPPWFRERGLELGLTFRHESGAGGEWLFPEIMGGGVALFDLQNDGDLDVYCVQAGRFRGGGTRPGNRLFRNDGRAKLTDITEPSGSGDAGYGMGVASGDINGDGFSDLFVTNVGPDVLLRSSGSETFDPGSATAEPMPGRWSTSAAFADIDIDGDLDLFVCQYVGWSAGGELECQTPAGLRDYCSPNSYGSPLSDVLLRNDGAGAFVDISFEAGLKSRRGNGLGVVAGDFDGDGRIDFFVANDQMENHLWRNGGNGTFEDIGASSGCAVDAHGSPKAGMGVVAEDVDGDWDLDLLVVNLQAQADSYFRNEGSFFVDQTARIGLGNASRRFTRFGIGMIDFDNDGHLDLYQANGRVQILAERAQRSEDPYAEPNQLFRGLDGRFEPVTPEGGVAGDLVHTSRAAAFGDLDNDGGVDVIVVNKDAEAYLLHNGVPDRGHWIRFRVVENGRDALGAIVALLDGERRVRRDVRSAYSYCAASDARVHFGLGRESGPVSVEVLWTDGTSESFGPFEIDRDVVLQRGEGR